MDEAAALGQIARHYGPAGFPKIGRQRAPEVEPGPLAGRRAISQ
jgi:hypothetical protein